MLFFIFGALCLVGAVILFKSTDKLNKQTLALCEKVRAEAAAEREALELAKKAANLPDEDEPYVRLPNGMMGKASEFETRADGELVRKDRFKVGFGNIVTILVGSRKSYDIEDIVEKVRVVAEFARADYESGGNGTPGSAPVWGPCPANCNGGLVSSGQECAVCDGRAEVVVEEPLTAAPSNDLAPHP